MKLGSWEHVVRNDPFQGWKAIKHTAAMQKGRLACTDA